MAYSVRDWMLDRVVIVDPDIPVSETLAMMRRRYIHSVIVDKSEDNPMYGIITSYDICDKIIAQNQDPTTTKTREIMNSPLITVSKEMSIEDCAKLMAEKKIHHLPVCEEGCETIIGMISATDFLVVAETISQKPGERIT